MKKFSILIIILIAGSIFVSCQKTVDEPAGTDKLVMEKTGNPFATPDGRIALVNTLKDFATTSSAERGAHFLPAFYTSWGFGFMDDDMAKLAVFSTAIDEDDFFRENPDGTVTVHIASNDAFSELFNYGTGDYYFGEDGHMVMNYTGPVMTIPVFDGEGNFLGFIYLVLPDQSSPASVWHGNGPVQLYGMGPEYNLVAKLIANAGWKKVNKSIKLN